LYLIDRIYHGLLSIEVIAVGGRPYVYSQTVIMKCFIVRIWFRLDSNNALHEFLEINYPYNNKIMKACGLTQIPDKAYV
jgi:hypothetical protein